MTIRYTLLPSPLGELVAWGDGDRLMGLEFTDTSRSMIAESEWEREDVAFVELAEQLAAYFDGDLTQFHLKLQANGTEFQRRVWDALCQIPYGTTTTYGRIAQQLGDPKAVRAVGLANGRNPISIVIPCHRVIGADGSLTGYGGGMDRKRWLLAHESGAQRMPW